MSDELIPGLPVLLRPRQREVCTRANYHAGIERRYQGHCYYDARRNWTIFEEQREEIRAWMAHYRRDPCFKIGEKCNNSDASLKGAAWLMAHKFSVGGSLGPFIDFEEHYQSCFLRRGLMIYMALLLEEIA